jgi:hypothetical protein
MQSLLLAITEQVSVVARAIPDISRRAMASIAPWADYPIHIIFTPSHTFDGIHPDLFRTR